jgi:cytochrome b6-f complex iron-sulfur subunit
VKSNEYDRINALVDSLLKDARSPRYRPRPEERQIFRVAILLRAARPCSELPDPRFLERLSRRLRSEFGDVGVDPTRLTRRRILGTAAVAAAAAAVGTVVDRIVQGNGASQTTQTLVPDRGAWRTIAAVSALPPGGAIRFSTNEVQGILLNDGGRVRALSAICTHLGCALSINAGSRRLDCPCHDLAYSWTGAVLHYRLQDRPPALPTIPTRLRGGMIEVLLP